MLFYIWNVCLLPRVIFIGLTGMNYIVRCDFRADANTEQSIISRPERQLVTIAYYSGLIGLVTGWWLFLIPAAIPCGLVMLGYGLLVFG